MQCGHRFRQFYCALAVVLSVTTIRAAEPQPVWLDTDIGTAIDDAYALSLVLADPRLKLVGVSTVTKPAEDRAWIACRLITQSGEEACPLGWGRDPQPENEIDWQIQYRRHPAVIFNRTLKPSQKPAAELLAEQLAASPEPISILAIGPLTNIAKLLKLHPDLKGRIKRIVIMGGSLEVGYNGKPPVIAEWNVKSDIPAAQAVFASGIPLTVVPLDVTHDLKISHAVQQQIFAACTRLTLQLQALSQLCNEPDGPLFDAVAVAALAGEPCLTTEHVKLQIDDEGVLHRTSGQADAELVTSVDRARFFNWCRQTLSAHGEQALPPVPENLSKFIPRGNFPIRVHAWEDFQTDIEKRWWMSGKLETENTAPDGGDRSCRGVLTQDFDGRMGQTKTSYTAVVFNPVPGPPMGPRTRLAFRYWIKGTDRLRVQLYSLTNGYHRYLSLENVPQGEWQTAAVDMTEMRRPDGSGGPLSENERIDDIQFYVDPRAELIIDDIVLYEAPSADEARPFPRRILYTGIFDTGKQGKEWPGDFEIVPHQPPGQWKFAQSVDNTELGRPWIRLHFRGLRARPNPTSVTFRYRLTGAKNFQVMLGNSHTRQRIPATVEAVNSNDWTETTVTFALPQTRPAVPEVDELVYLLPPGAQFQVDDVLVYGEGKTPSE